MGYDGSQWWTLSMNTVAEMMRRLGEVFREKLSEVSNKKYT
ncbi:MAG: hypothetical protein ACR2KX_20445 [Chitinophagaceae bacterium]